MNSNRRSGDYLSRFRETHDAEKLLVVLGIASLVVPIPRNETQGIKIGDASIGVQTSHSESVSPIISVVLISDGIALTIAGAVVEKVSGTQPSCSANSARSSAFTKAAVG